MKRKKQSKKRQPLSFILYTIALISLILIPGYRTAAIAAGNIYYVDFNYSGLESGSSDQPYNTMNEAVVISNSGDRIYIKEGTYNISSHRIEDIGVRNFNPACTCENHSVSEMLTITVDPATSGKVILNPSGDFGNESFFRIFDSRCVNFDGDNRMIIDGSSATFDRDTPLVAIFSYKDVVENITFEKVEVRNSSGRGISFRQEIDAPPGNIVIRNNKIHDIAHRAVGGFGNTVYIEGNEIWNAAMSNLNQSYGSGGWPGVIQTARRYDDSENIYHYSRNIFVRHNIIHDSWGEGIIMHFTLGGQVTLNTIYDVFSVYIYIDTSKDIRVDKNHIYRTTDKYDRKDKLLPVTNGISFASEAYSWGGNQVPIMTQNLLISNNLLDNVGKGVSRWHDSGNRYSTNSYKDIFVFHNILRNLQHTPILIDEVPDNLVKPSNGRVKNNIIENRGTGKADTYSIGNENSWIFSNNNWTGGLPSYGIHVNSHEKGSGFAGPDLSIGSDPENYRLAKGSVNISAGTSTPVAEDYWGTVRQSTNPSIGIHEYDVNLVAPTDLQVSMTLFALPD